MADDDDSWIHDVDIEGAVRQYQEAKAGPSKGRQKQNRKRNWRRLIQDYGDLPSPDPTQPPTNLDTVYGGAAQEIANNW